ncbi:MAG: 50S ribosomal protein L25, partial [Nitrosomonadaceae bacterium]
IVSHVLTELDISCLPKDLPEYIQVDLAELAANNSVHLSDLKMPHGVEIPMLTRGGSNSAVATIIIPRAVVSEESTVATVAAADIPTTVQKEEEEDEQEIDKKDAGKKK